MPTARVSTLHSCNWCSRWAGPPIPSILPKLAAEVGIAPGVVILILMLDQAIFTITDTAMGIAADRIATLVGHLSVFVGPLTALSCAAFAALPFIAGAGAKIPLIALIAIWAITSSALHAPPLTLLGNIAPGRNCRFWRRW